MDATTASRGVLPKMRLPTSIFQTTNNYSSLMCPRTRVMAPSCKLSQEGRKILCQCNQASVAQSYESTAWKGSVLGGLSVQSHRDPVGKTSCSVGVCTYTGSATESRSYTAEEKIGVLLLNLGGPETLHDVQPFFVQFVC